MAAGSARTGGGAALATTMVTAVGHFEKMHHPVLAQAVAYLLAKLLLCAPHVCECVHICTRFFYEVSFSCKLRHFHILDLRLKNNVSFLFSSQCVVQIFIVCNFRFRIEP